MKGIINIKGQIGSDSQTRGVELVDVIMQAQAIPQDSKEVDILIESPGGFKDTGDQIYNYLLGLKAKYKLNTIQKGDVGSIATKIFMVGDNRILNSRYEFFIHNPWVSPGPVDANDAAQLAMYLQASKKDLLDFYAMSTGAETSALEPLMDLQTGLKADQAKALGFATEVVTDIQVFASVKKQNMKDKTALEKLVESIQALVKPSVKAMDIDLADGRKLSSDAQDAATMIGSKAMIDNAPAPDGDYPTKDGKVINVMGGVIAEVATKEAEVKEDAPVVAKIAALEASVKALAESVSAFIESSKSQPSVQSLIETQIKALRAEIVSDGRPPKQGNQNSNAFKKSPIQMAMEKRIK